MDKRAVEGRRLTWVTDLSHFIDVATGDLPTKAPGPARRLMEHMTRIVAAATKVSAGRDPAVESVRCRRRPGHHACGGVIEHRLWADERITWCCPRCGDNGVITNWQSTRWDGRAAQPVH